MHHGPSTEWKDDSSTGKKTKLGIWMFLIYTLIYIGFIVINNCFPKLMAADVGSLNVAIVYGFGLIVVALIQAFIYNHICTRAEEKAIGEENLTMEREQP